MTDLIIPELSDVDKRNLDYWIDQQGLEFNITNALNSIDCTRTFTNGVRLIQTIDFKYSVFVAECLYLINKVEDEEERNKLLQRVDEIHENNLKFEEATPPVVYDKTKKLKSNRRKTNADKTPRVTNAEKKLKKKLEKLASLKFVIKPKNDG